MRASTCRSAAALSPSPRSRDACGPSLDTLYLTSARIDLTEAELTRQPLAGALFVAHPGVVGLPAHEFAG